MKIILKTLPLLALATGLTMAEPIIINDAKLISSFQKGVGGFADGDDPVSAETLAEQAKDAQSHAGGLTLAESCPVQLADGVFLIGSVYKCGKCDKWHPGGIASAWALTEDGVMVSNYHVFEKAKGAAMGVCDRNGRTYRITEVLAVDKGGDVAIFRVDADDLKPLPLGPSAEVGSGVRVISHPSRRFYMQTSGKVARYHAQPKRKDRAPTTWMSITADYAKGSSGGPVFDDKGRVIGMVASTQSIYYESNDGKPKGPLQMVVKNCVPVSVIKALLEPKGAAVEAALTD